MPHNNNDFSRRKFFVELFKKGATVVGGYLVARLGLGSVSNSDSSASSSADESREVSATSPEDSIVLPVKSKKINKWG